MHAPKEVAGFCTRENALPSYYRVRQALRDIVQSGGSGLGHVRYQRSSRRRSDPLRGLKVTQTRRRDSLV